MNRNKLMALLAGALVLAGCSRTPENTVRIGTKNFTEQLVLGELMAQIIEAQTDVNVDRVFNLGGTMVCHNGLESDALDIYAEYTGTALTAILKEDVVRDPEQAYTAVDAAYGDRWQCDWLAPFGFNNTYAVTVRRDFAEEHKLETISDLARLADTLKAGFTAEFMERDDGYPGLREAYGLEFKHTADMDPGIMYEAVAQGHVDVICAFATDGRIAAYDLRMLDDDRRFFPPYYAAPVIRGAVKAQYPAVAAALEKLGGTIDDDAMRRMNYAVDEARRDPEDVAREFLENEGLIQ